MIFRLKLIGRKLISVMFIGAASKCSRILAPSEHVSDGHTALAGRLARRLSATLSQRELRRCMPFGCTHFGANSSQPILGW